MKKIISLSLALILTLSLGAALVACDEHECEFKEEWASNDTHHWHECKGENCLEVADKGEHDWDEGTVNEEASTETTEELTYTCKTCGAVKGESVELEGAVEEAEWDDEVEIVVQINGKLRAKIKAAVDMPAAEVIALAKAEEHLQ